MADSKKAFVLGPGYVGRTLIDFLLADGYDVTTIVRREEAEKELSSAGVKAIRGDLNDGDLIRDLASQSDVVFHTATSDHLPSAEAILEGIKQRANRGLQTIYLHQSGTALLGDGSSERANPQIFSDSDTAAIDALPANAPHRSIDLAILKTRNELGSKAKIFIMIPPIIYGTDPKYKRLSIQIPSLTRFALKHRYAGYAGKGQGKWAAIHVLDLDKAYITILRDLRKPSPELDLEKPYFFCEAGEISWSGLADILAKTLYKQGKVDHPEAREIPESEWGDLFGEFTPTGLGCNARCKADRLRKLGWKPEAPSIATAYEQEDLPVLLQE